MGCESCCLFRPQPAVYPGQPLVSGGSSQAGLYCAHRTSTVSSCAFCEHVRSPGCSLFPSFPPHFPPHTSVSQQGGLDWSLTARIEGAHSDRAHSASERDHPGRPVPPLTALSPRSYNLFTFLPATG